jgi:hypothetical protein
MEGDCGPFAAREQIAKRQQAINERMVAELCVGNTVQELALPARDRKACAFDAQLNSMITNLRSCEKATILNVQLDMQFDRRYGSRPAERRVVMVRRKAGIAELRIAVGLQDRRASGHSLSGHQGIDIEHHAHGRVGIEIREEARAALEEHGPDVNDIEHARQLNGLRTKFRVALPIQRRHPFEVIDGGLCLFVLQ